MIHSFEISFYYGKIQRERLWDFDDLKTFHEFCFTQILDWRLQILMIYQSPSPIIIRYSSNVQHLNIYPLTRMNLNWQLWCVYSLTRLQNSFPWFPLHFYELAGISHYSVPILVNNIFIMNSIIESFTNIPYCQVWTNHNYINFGSFSSCLSLLKDKNVFSMIFTVYCCICGIFVTGGSTQMSKWAQNWSIVCLDEA